MASGLIHWPTWAWRKDSTGEAGEQMGGACLEAGSPGGRWARSGLLSRLAGYSPREGAAPEAG